MRVLDPILDAAFTQLGATEEEKAAILANYENQASSIRGQVQGLYANAEMSFAAAQALEPQAVAIESLLEKFTNIVEDPVPPETPTE